MNSGELSYELAKELKDAGFTQTGKSIMIVMPGNGVFYEAPIPAYVPTLEELIEACGKPFMLMHFKEDGYNWQAFNDTDSVCELAETGETAIEATAKLWLAIKKKS